MNAARKTVLWEKYSWGRLFRWFGCLCTTVFMLDPIQTLKVIIEGQFQRLNN